MELKYVTKNMANVNEVFGARDTTDVGIAEKKTETGTAGPTTIPSAE